MSEKVGRNIPEMVGAMSTAYEHMLGPGSAKYGPFRASVDYEGGWLNVYCPGDACGLNPDSNGLEGDGRGYEFSCHNVDSPAQQLTLLAGLAALHDRVDRELAE